MAEYMDISYVTDGNENQLIERVKRERPYPFEDFNDAKFQISFVYQRSPYYSQIMTFIYYREGSDRLYFVPPMLQLSITLYFFSFSCFQRTDGQMFGVHSTTVCRVIKNISRAMASLSQRYITFPQNRELINLKHIDISGIPN